MKNKILWVLFNVSLGIELTLISFLSFFQVEKGSYDWLRLVFWQSVVFPVLILVIVNFFVLNIDWSKATDWWKEL